MRRSRERPATRPEKMAPRRLQRPGPEVAAAISVGMVRPAMSQLVPELSEFLVKSLDLSDVTPESIDPKAPLFGPGAGLGLDSIDALELTQALAKTYGVKVTPDDEQNRAIFASIESLAEYVEKNRTR